jgi:cation/acetate symporter
VSLLTKEPSKEIQDLVENLRNPITDDEGMTKMLDKMAPAK